MAELKYYKRYRTGEGRREISYEEALDTLLTTYKDNDMTRDMLMIANNIVCVFSTVYVEEVWDDDRILVLMPGLQNMLPLDAEYDDEGNRL